MKLAGRPMTVSDSIIIAAAPGDLYDAVSDVRQMGRWSPENMGAVVLGPPTTEAYVGMRFIGDNTRGPMSWRTKCEVTDADPGRRFAFRVYRYGYLIPPVLPIDVASWAYDFESLGEDNTRVTETWQDDRALWPDVVADTFDRFATGGRTFREFQLKNIRRTLANLKKEFDAS